MNYRCVYSLGSRCYTEMALQKYNYKEFSSIFGSIDNDSIENVIKCFDSKFDILLNPTYLMYTCQHEKFNNLNKEHGFRTLNSNFDRIDDYYDATFPHHDLSNTDTQKHFERGIERLNKMAEKNIPVLFIFQSYNDNTSIDEARRLYEAIKQYGFKYFHLIILNYNPLLYYVEHYKHHSEPGLDIFEIKCNSNLKKVNIDELPEILKEFDISNRITIKEIDNM